MVYGILINRINRKLSEYECGVGNFNLELGEELRELKKNLKHKEGVCMQQVNGLSQRIEEIIRGVGHNGTIFYSRLGCFTCNGNKKDCSQKSIY